MTKEQAQEIWNEIHKQIRYAMDAGYAIGSGRNPLRFVPRDIDSLINLRNILTKYTGHEVE